MEEIDAVMGLILYTQWGQILKSSCKEDTSIWMPYEQFLLAEFH